MLTRLLLGGILLGACGGGAEVSCSTSEPRAASVEHGASADPSGTEPQSAPPTVEPGAPDCTDEARAARAVARVLAHASGAAGISASALAGCAFEPARCGPEPGGEDPSRCVVSVRADEGFWYVRVTPAPVPSAPRWLEANLEPTATEPPLRFWASASTWASIGSSITIGGVDGHISHSHGGDPAEIDRAELLVRNGASAPVVLRVREVSWLTANGCEVPDVVEAMPTVIDVAVGDVVSATSEIAIPPGESTLVVRFAPQSAYYAYCERFAARVTFAAGRDTVTAIAEWIVASRMPR